MEPQRLTSGKRMLEEREEQLSELRLQFDDPRRSEHRFGNCVVYRHDDGVRNVRFLRADGTWTNDQYAAALCLDMTEAVQLCGKYGVAIFGRPDPRRACCDVIGFRYPDDYEKWLDKMNRYDDDD